MARKAGDSSNYFLLSLNYSSTFSNKNYMINFTEIILKEFLLKMRIDKNLIFS